MKLSRKGLLALIVCCCCFSASESANFFNLNFKQSTNRVVVGDYFYKLEYSVYRNNEKIQTVNILTGLGGLIQSRPTTNGFILSGRGDPIDFAIEADEPNYSQFSVTRRQVMRKQTDCIDLHTQNSVHWYGGNEQRWQHYPIEKMTHKHNAYVSKEEFNQAIAERYWLSSNGVYFFVDENVPLFLDQNHQYINYLCLEAHRALPYDIHSGSRFDFNYHVGIAKNAKEVHMKAIAKFLGKPSGHPAEAMVREPIWSTWARYKAKINETILITFANEIKSNLYNGQFEIDDAWETCYGATQFSQQVFPNIKTIVQQIKSMGFRVTLWIHPFINVDCVQWLEEAKNKSYLVTDRNGKVETQWWNSGTKEAAYIDFTNPAAADWFVAKLRKLQENEGIDSFKFDAGEISWSPTDPIYYSRSRNFPHQIVKDYVRTCAKLGDLVEVRSAQGTQDLPIFLRMIDKDTEWTVNNGLPSLITTMLQMNMVGYPFVLPDMIGGNGYNDVTPDREIFIRWLQANAFMPSIQFSFVPWIYDEEVRQISHKYVDLHASITSYIMERFDKAVATGEPVNPPIWWIAPNDKIAQRIDDQFLLGEKYLVAPVIIQGAVKRDIYLPVGKWTDGNTGEVHDVAIGGKTLVDYSAPLSVLPYFIKS